MIQYAVMRFSQKQSLVGSKQVTGWDIGEWILEDLPYQDIQEAETARIRYLKLAPTENPQNIQVIQYVV